MIELDIAVIGGGFSGAAVAAHAARIAPSHVALAVFEAAELGRGAAYGGAHDAFVLNTRVSMMSLYANEPDHFARWLGSAARPSDFVSRRLYGTYVNQTAQRAMEGRPFTHVVDRVARITRGDDGRFVVEASNGTRFVARAVILASGNPPPSSSFLPQSCRLHPGYVAEPWQFDYRRVGGHVLVIGSGLTALDVLVALDACGHRGTVHVVSRHGRYPETHANVAPYDVIPALDTASALALARSFRRHLAEAQARGFDWRAVVDALRPEAEAIWRRLPEPERRRFERHLRAQWERRRHRAPESVEAVRRRYEESKRLFTYAGVLRDVRESVAVLALRNGTTVELRPDWIVNCTGPGGAPGIVRDNLVAQMVVDGLVSVNPLNLGLQTTPSLQSVGSRGDVVQGLWIVGPPVRGSRAEATAVPELRLMAQSASADALRSLGHGEGSVTRLRSQT